MYSKNNPEKRATLDDLYQHLRHMAQEFPAWIEKVDADASDQPELWGERAFRIVLPYGQQIWIKEARAEKHKREETQ